MKWLSLVPVAVSKKNMRPVSFSESSRHSVTVGQPSPNDSSMKLTTSPSQLNVDECQKSTATSPAVPDEPGPSVSVLSS
jgi:hypothetical protein